MRSFEKAADGLHRHDDRSTMDRGQIHGGVIDAGECQDAQELIGSEPLGRVVVPHAGERLGTRPELAIGDGFKCLQQLASLAPSLRISREVGRAMGERGPIRVGLHDKRGNLGESKLTPACEQLLEFAFVLVPESAFLFVGVLAELQPSGFTIDETMERRLGKILEEIQKVLLRLEAPRQFAVHFMRNDVLTVLRLLSVVEPLALDEDAGVAYITTHRQNTIERVPLNPQLSDAKQTVAGIPFDERLVGPTSLRWGQGDKDVLLNAAVVYQDLRETSVALEWLKKSLDAGVSAVTVLEMPTFDTLKSDLRFQTLVKGRTQ